MRTYCCLAFLLTTLFLCGVTVGSSTEGSYYHFTYNIVIAGSPPLDIAPIAHMVIEQPHNIPLRIQVDYSCGSTSLAMVMDWLGEPYHTQEWYDVCVARGTNETTTIWRIKNCANQQQGVFLVHYMNVDVPELEVGDIVLYHMYGYDNVSDNHFAVVDYVYDTDEMLSIANPHGCYDMWQFDEFEMRFTGEVLRNHF